MFFSQSFSCIWLTQLYVLENLLGIDWEIFSSAPAYRQTFCKEIIVTQGTPNRLCLLESQFCFFVITILSLYYSMCNKVKGVAHVIFCLICNLLLLFPFFIPYFILKNCYLTTKYRLVCTCRYEPSKYILGVRTGGYFSWAIVT